MLQCGKGNELFLSRIQMNLVRIIKFLCEQFETNQANVISRELNTQGNVEIVSLMQVDKAQTELSFVSKRIIPRFRLSSMLGPMIVTLFVLLGSFNDGNCTALGHKT